MNTIYRLVFNRALRVWQVASELVKGGGGLVGHVRAGRARRCRRWASR
jgi:filamentous hemagglutinin